MGYLQLPEPFTPKYRALPVPTLMLVGGVILGVLVAMLSRVFSNMGAHRRARTADRRLRSAIAEVTEELVIGPIEVEVEAYRRARDGLATALR